MTIGVELLRAQDLRVAFRRQEGAGAATRVPVLNGVTLSLAPGEVVAIVGESGAGKSILAHALLGLLPSSAELSGTVTYLGEPLTEARLNRLRGRDLALVPQSVGFLDPLLKAKSAVRLAARRAGLGPAESVAAQKCAFSRLALSDPAGNAYPFELSGGMARRVLLAMALVGNAKLLIADEPTPGLDPESVRESMTLLRAFADEGRTILLISHDIMAAVAVADRVAVLVDGAIVEVAPACAFSGTGERLEHAYSRALWSALPNNAFALPMFPLKSGTDVHCPTGSDSSRSKEPSWDNAAEDHA